MKETIIKRLSHSKRFTGTQIQLQEACLKIVLTFCPGLDMGTLGKVDDVRKEFVWRIDNFLSLSIKNGESCKSSLFSFGNESWFMSVYPNGRSNDSVEHVSLYFSRNVTGPPIHLLFSIGLKTSKGKKDQEVQFGYVFEKAGGFGLPKFLRRSALLEKKLELVPSDTLTVVCTIEYYYKLTDDVGSTAKCSHCKETFSTTNASSHKQKCLEKPIRCPTCKDVVKLRKWFDHECETARVKATEKLNGDLKNIFNNKELSDVTIRVKDDEFHLHRCILAGRNSYFNSMFNTEMTEKSTGIVSIEDCEPEIFHSFIHFVYTGKVDEISVENVCNLYKTVDKYQEDQLKEECVCFMKAKMSIETFCDFIVLALKYDEKELLQVATELFCNKTEEIIKSVKWQTFMREYPTEANELYLKAFQYNVK